MTDTKIDFGRILADLQANYTYTELAEREHQERERQEKKERVGWEERGVTPLYFGATWDNWRRDSRAMTDTLAKVRKAWVSNVLMTGSVGTGKTHLAMCLAKDGAYYTRFADISRRIRAKFDNEEAVLESLAEKRLLIIDEVGRGKGSDFNRDTLFEVIDRRYNNKKPTTLITNMSLDEFKTEYGAALMDRFRPLTAVFSWASYRGKV
jgi:DNA replication protein DnaC